MKKSPPWIPRFLLSLIRDKTNHESLIGDYEETFHYFGTTYGYAKARIWYWGQVFKALPFFISNSIRWGFAMFHNYLKITFRNIKKHKGYSLINITGLAVGIACCLLIVLYVGFEMSYDSYHQDADRIYRIGTHIDRSGEKRTVTSTCVPFAPYVRQNFPQVEQAARISRRVNPLVKSGDNVFFEDSIIYADKEIMDIYKERSLTAYGRNTITSFPRLFEELEKIRKQGYAIDDEEYYEGVRCVAAPIRAGGKITAALSITGSIFTMTIERINRELIGLVTKSAKEISSEMQW